MPSPHRGTSERAAATQSEYWTLSRTPLCCLIFLLPLLTIYEVALVWHAGSSEVSLQNGADYWMRSWLTASGYEISWLLPVMIVVLLLSWQIASRKPWKIHFETLIGMGAESLLYACLLLLIAHAQNDLFSLQVRRESSLFPLCAVDLQFARTISFLGAGLYEEVLFRLMALPLGYLILRGLRLSPGSALVGAICWTSLLFSLAHYWGPAGDDFTWFTFVFRLLAGLFFSTLFVVRGFGITVGTHAAYDILVGVVLQP